VRKQAICGQALRHSFPMKEPLGFGNKPPMLGGMRSDPSHASGHPESTKEWFVPKSMPGYQPPPPPPPPPPPDEPPPPPPEKLEPLDDPGAVAAEETALANAEPSWLLNALAENARLRRHTKPADSCCYSGLPLGRLGRARRRRPPTIAARHRGRRRKGESVRTIAESGPVG